MAIVPRSRVQDAVYICYAETMIPCTVAFLSGQLHMYLAYVQPRYLCFGIAAASSDVCRGESLSFSTTRPSQSSRVGERME